MATIPSEFETFSCDISCKTICIYGGSGTGKTCATKTILNENFRRNAFTVGYCWAPKVSITNNNYQMIFGEQNCRHDFENFQQWYIELAEEATRQIVKRDVILNDDKIFLALFKLLPQKEIEDALEIASTVLTNACNEEELPIDDNDATKLLNNNDSLVDSTLAMDVLKQIGMPMIINARQKIRKKHGDCSIKRCAICYYTGIQRPIILLDDFGMNKDEVMAYPFSMAPTLSRHLSMSIIVLSQVYELVKNSFKINTQILFFTSRVALSEMLTHQKTSMSSTLKTKLTNIFDSMKKYNKWACFVLDQSSGGLDILSLVPSDRHYNYLYRFGRF